MTPYFDDGQVTIYHGDCRDVLPLLTHVDSVLTDPPYGVGFSGKRTKYANGSVVKRSGSYAFPDTPEYISSVVVPLIEMCRSRWRSVAVTPGTRNAWLYPSPDDVGCWYSAAATGMGRWGFSCCQPILYYGADPYQVHGGGARPNSVGQVWPNDANKSGHPCAKPIGFVRWLVARASLEGETVLDPFMGSGTTIRAARDLGRKVIGIELEERYCEITVQRLAQTVLPLTG